MQSSLGIAHGVERQLNGLVIDYKQRRDPVAVVATRIVANDFPIDGHEHLQAAERRGVELRPQTTKDIADRLGVCPNALFALLIVRPPPQRFHRASTAEHDRLPPVGRNP